MATYGWEVELRLLSHDTGWIHQASNLCPEVQTPRASAMIFSLTSGAKPCHAAISFVSASSVQT